MPICDAGCDTGMQWDHAPWQLLNGGKSPQAAALVRLQLRVGYVPHPQLGADVHTSFAVKVPPTFRRGAVSFKQSRQRSTHLVERLQNGTNRGDD